MYFSGSGVTCSAGEHHLDLLSIDIGPAVLFRPRQAQPLLVFVAREAMRVTARPILVFADGRRVKIPRSWSSVARGGAWAMRVRPSGAERVELAITVRDSAGTDHRSTRVIYG